MTSDRPRVGDGGVPPAAPPHTVRLPVNIHHWDRISFLHWPVDPTDLAAVVPEDLTVLTFDGTAWVGVTLFFIRVRPPGVPVVPPGWAFPETNVRTYVAGPDGRQGVWFLHMEVTAAWFVATLRALGLPYVRRRMTVDIREEGIAYRSQPRGSSPRDRNEVVVSTGAELRPAEGGARERFLTARWGAYHRRGPLLLYTPVAHPPWSLHAAEVGTCEVGPLFRDAGLTPPVGQPVAHFSPGTRVEVGRPRVVT